MGERKVLNKYYPPDFDPTKLPKGKRVRSEDKQMKVRMMLPMSVRCNTCGTFMYKGTKFNTRMEDVRGENYLGIKIFRFYYRCTHCSAEFCMKTDPKTADYIVEGGATRNYEPWRDAEKAKVDAVVQREEEERGNAMKALENRTLDSKREMDILSALDEMKSLKARHAQVDTEAALAALKRSAAQRELDLTAEDEAAVQQMLMERAGFVRRLSDSEGEGGSSEEEDRGAAGAGAGPGPSSAAAAGGAARAGSKRKLAARGGGGGGGGGLAGPSVAAAMWEDDEDGGEGDGGEGAGGSEGRGGAGGLPGEGALAPGNEQGGASGSGRAGAAGAASQQPAAAAAATEGGGGQQKPPAAQAAQAPPPLPGFSVRARPVVVAVKRKAEQLPTQPQRQQQQQQQPGGEKDGGESSGGAGGALAGLGAYGSSSDSD